MSKNDKKHSDDEVTSRRELLSATAKLSAFIAAMGLAGTGIAGGAAADTSKVYPKVEMKRNQQLLPAVQKREMKLLLRDAMRTGDTRAALKRHPGLKLNPRQKAALNRMTRQDWVALRSLQSKLAPLEELAAGDTGYVFW